MCRRNDWECFVMCTYSRPDPVVPRHVVILMRCVVAGGWSGKEEGRDGLLRRWCWRRGQEEGVLSTCKACGANVSISIGWCLANVPLVLSLSTMQSKNLFRRSKNSGPVAVAQTHPSTHLHRANEINLRHPPFTMRHVVASNRTTQRPVTNAQRATPSVTEQSTDDRHHMVGG